jgi:hypothetical protein
MTWRAISARLWHEEEPQQALKLREALDLHGVIESTLRLEGRSGWPLSAASAADTAASEPAALETAW